MLPLYDSTLAIAAQSAANRLPIGVDWEAVNQAVLSRAQSEAARFAQQATDTSRAQTSQVIADWIKTGGSKKELIDRLGAVWSGPRADVAATTEITRLYATGNQAAWQESGVVKGYRFNTSNDETVCPLCGPLGGEEFDLDDTENMPPIHPQCRCWLTPITIAPEEL